MRSFLRIGGTACVAILVWAALTGLLLLLPGRVSLGTMYVGLVLFLIGGKLHWPWTAAVGGVLMFGGGFAAALLGALG